MNENEWRKLTAAKQILWIRDNDESYVREFINSLLRRIWKYEPPKSFNG